MQKEVPLDPYLSEIMDETLDFPPVFRCQYALDDRVFPLTNGSPDPIDDGMKIICPGYGIMGLGKAMEGKPYM
jgi:hypothetical protein